MSDNTALEERIIETDDDIIARNQGIRRRLVDHLTEGGKIPEDTKEKYVLLQALADGDRTAIQNKKIGSSEKQGAADRQAALIIAKMSKGFGTRSPFEREGDAPTETRTLDSSKIPDVTLVPGETEIGLPTDNFDSFMGRMEGSESKNSPAT